MPNLFLNDPDSPPVDGPAPGNTDPVFFTGEKRRRPVDEPDDWLPRAEKALQFRALTARLWAQYETGFKYTVEFRSDVSPEWIEVWAKYKRTDEPFVPGPECQRLRRMMKPPVPDSELLTVVGQDVVDKFFVQVRDC